MGYVKIVIKMAASFFTSGIRSIGLMVFITLVGIHKRMKRRGKIYGFVGC